ncbi:hypothetical protein Anapl_01874 [Anas platyrhynchos]|uniref:Uncharacterized protein n=1 Tax=Anas platyrhynchos TaxID=8839 RepID=R0KE06_ANAPL|nr:hypothetical protein Anapl_01874 [Anas platyrhynchos]
MPKKQISEKELFFMIKDNFMRLKIRYFEYRYMKAYTSKAVENVSYHKTTTKTLPDSHVAIKIQFNCWPPSEDVRPHLKQYEDPYSVQPTRFGCTF